MPLHTIMDIFILISYIIERQHFKFGLGIATSNLQTSIQLDLSKKKIDLQLWSLKLKSHFLGRFVGNWVWEVRG